MDKQKLVKGLEEYISSFREKVDQNDGSGVAAIAESARQSIATMKHALMDSDKSRRALENAHEYLSKLEKAAKEGDKQLTAKLLGLLENAVKDWSAKAEDDKKDKDE
ncbi:hypothetical protein LJB81_01530 [Desulfovibrio sp. OttesenSCG-928-M14]|nr:hypothetical protein [Desulfovibrio sp. OttesenSCG-928-M14]